MNEPHISSGDFNIGEWLVEPSLNQITDGDTRLRLEPKVMELLLCLVRRGGEVISKEDLIEQVWSDRFVTDEVITTAMHELRKALGDEARNPRFIQTIPRKGYRLIAHVTPATAPATNHQSESSSPSQAGSAGRLRGWRKPLAAALGCLLLALSLWQMVIWQRNPAGAAADARIRSLAVLPLRNLTGDAAQEYLADAVTDALISELASQTGLRIVSRTTVTPYKAANKSMPEIARELGVDALIEGSVVRAGSLLRVNVRMVRAATDEHMWADSYERELSDVLELQKHLSPLIARDVRSGLERVPRRSDSVPAAALEACNKGRRLWHKYTEAAVRQSLAQFEHAVALAPDYAPAHAGLADAWLQLVTLDALRPDEGFPRARAAAFRALQLDNRLAEAHASLGMIRLSYEWDWTGAEAEFRRAIALRPDYALAYHWYSQQLWAAGRTAEALQAARKARALAPESLPVLLNAGNIFYLLHHHDEAIAGFRAVLDIDPNQAVAWKFLGRAYADKDMQPEAEAAFERHLQLSGAPPVARLLRDFAAWSRSGDPQYLLHKLSLIRNRSYVRPTFIARLYLDLGDRESALVWLEKAFAERDSSLLLLKADQGWEGLRDDPRFAALVQRVGLGS